MVARQGMAIEFGGVVLLFAAGLLDRWSWRAPFLLYAVAWLALVLVAVFVPATPVRSGTATPRAAPTGLLRSLGGPYLAAMLSMVVFITGLIVLPGHLRGLGLGPTRIGALLSFTPLVAVGFAAIMPGTTRRRGAPETLVLAFLGYAAANLLYLEARSGLEAGIAAVLMGCGFGLAIPLVNHMTIECSPPEHRGRALALLSMAIFLGQFLARFVPVAASGTDRAFELAALLAALPCAGVAATAWRGGATKRI